MNLREVGDLNLLTALIWGEARGEPFDGMMAVAFVVRNRKADARWPDTWVDVILQTKQFSCFNLEDVNHHQVLRAILPSRNGNWQDPTWRECRFAAYGVMGNWRRDITSGANHYHTVQISPYWAHKQEICYRVGNHFFYKL